MRRDAVAMHQVFAGQPRREPVAVTYDRLGKGLERLVGCNTGDVGDQVGLLTVGHVVQNLFAQQLRGPVVDFLKLRADPGLKRETPQDRGAERVDRLDPQSARCFDGAREQGPGARQELGGQAFGRFAQFEQLFRQGLVIQHCPFAQPLEQAVLHLACGGIGEGQAQDVFRPCIAQQQAGHPVCQNARLA